MSEDPEPTSEAIAGRVAAEIEKAGAIYAGFMHEVKMRMASIDAALSRIAQSGETENAFLDAEFCFLQLRMVCEDIALACLVAHNEFPEANTKALLKSWNADLIFDRLTAVNEHCYPKPMKIVVLPSGDKQLQPIDGSHLTRDGLKKLYHACGKNLHRGMLLHVLEGKRKAYDVQLLRKWFDSLLRLLHLHTLLFPNLNAALMVRMSNEEGEVSCSWLVGLHGKGFVVSDSSGLAPSTSEPDTALQSEAIAETVPCTPARSSSS